MATKIIPIANPKIKDHTGKRFGRLVVNGYVGMDGRYAVFSCSCDCGNEMETKGYHLARGVTRSCGCLQSDRTSEMLKARNTTHGLRRSPEYKIWEAMIRRCSVPSCKEYEFYGGRGIKVCDRWRSSFEAFYADMGARPSSTHQIDRQDNYGNYEPGNCRWAVTETQARNRRSNIVVEYAGEQMILKDAAILAGVMPATAYRRHAKGWPIERVLSPLDYRLA